MSAPPLSLASICRLQGVTAPVVPGATTTGTGPLEGGLYEAERAAGTGGAYGTERAPGTGGAYGTEGTYGEGAYGTQGTYDRERREGYEVGVGGRGGGAGWGGAGGLQTVRGRVLWGVRPAQPASQGGGGSTASRGSVT